MSNKVALAIRELHQAEADLARELLQVSDRHKADHEVHHVARDIARWSFQHVHELARCGRDYGLNLTDEVSTDPDLVARARQKGSELLGRHHTPALLLLTDLRKVHRMAAGLSLDWEVLAQSAQALKDAQLLAVTKDCHPQTLRQLRWANAQLKEHAAQVMITG